MNKMYTHDSQKNNFTIQMSYKWQKAVTWFQSKIVTLQQKHKKPLNIQPP